MTQPKKLIEVAMPIKEISAESVRDKSIRHGHISTLHLWWARRPLPVCRAVVFASLVPDPLDENCTQAFKDAVEILLGKSNNPGDPYKPYDDIPYTAAVDKMEDNLRNRLLMFIGKFSDKYSANEKIGKKTDAKDQLSDFSLIKWDNKNNEEIINKARKLIWVAYNSQKDSDSISLLTNFDNSYTAIKEAEGDLYSVIDRNIITEEARSKENKLEQKVKQFLDRMPKAFDPFAGGGAIPLEAARLGCRSYGNDINPVAHIIQKGSVEFPQRFGKPIKLSTNQFIDLYGREEFNKVQNENKVYQSGECIAVTISNRLSFDVEFYAKRLLYLTEIEIGHFFPKDNDGRRPIAYYWSRVGTCSNPTCKAEVPLLRGFYLVNNASKQVYLSPILKGKEILFEIRNGKCAETGWMEGRSMNCPICKNPTPVTTLKEQSKKNNLKLQLLAVIEDSPAGK